MTSIKLDDILDKTHGLYQMANRMNWDYLVNELGAYYCEGPGRPEISIRVIAGLHYLKYPENESDESVVEKFCENPYWQYFCGLETFVHTLPCHPTTLVKWRHRIGEKGIEKLLSHTLDTAKREALLPEKLLKKVNVDTTVQEKAITFPTDTKLCHSTSSLCACWTDEASQEKHTPHKLYSLHAPEVECIAKGKAHHPAHVNDMISGKKNLPRRLKQLLKGRSGIEPIIGHLKNDHRLSRNYLLGKTGDKINAILSGCAFNLNKLLHYFNAEPLCFA